MPPLPEGLVPYDGKKPLPGVKEDPDADMPPLPAGLVPYDGKKPLPGVKEPAAAEPAAPAKHKVKPAVPAPVHDRINRQLLQDAMDALAESEAAIAAVPAIPSGVSTMAGASVLESGTVGGYGGAVASAAAAPRNLMEQAAPGSYGGGRNLLADVSAMLGGYGGGRNLLADIAGSYGGGRNLLGELAGGYGGAAARNLLADTPGIYGSTRNLLADQPAASKKQQPKAVEAKKTSSSTSSTPASRPLGTCYCHYNPASGSWALEQAACRAALFKRCGAAYSMLECSAVEAFYHGLAMPGSEAPHRDTISAFLYVDCPPAPPCSCKGIVTGAETPTARSRCCADLRAHCQVPFSGLNCEDVRRFCQAGTQPSDPVGALFSYVLVKTHGHNCASPRLGAAYMTVTAPVRPQASEAVRMLAKAAVLDSLAASSSSGSSFDEPDRVAMALTMLVGGLFAVAVAALGVAVLLRVGAAHQHAAPLLA